MTDAKYYCLIDETGTVANIIMWDGVSAYNPPQGHKLVQSTSGGLGDVYDDQQKTFTKVEQQIIEVVKPPSLEERLDALQQQVDSLSQTVSVKAAPLTEG